MYIYIYCIFFNLLFIHIRCNKNTQAYNVCQEVFILIHLRCLKVGYLKQINLQIFSFLRAVEQKVSKQQFKYYGDPNIHKHPHAHKHIYTYRINTHN